MSRWPPALPWLLMIAGIILAAGCAGPSEKAWPGADAAANPSAAAPMFAADVYRKCEPSVVPLGFARKDAADPKTTHTEYGTGVIVHEDGYILTNAHILRRGGDGAAGIRGRDYPCRIVAVDEMRDLAILKIDAEKPLAPIQFGRSSSLVPGEQIVTIGSPFGVGLSVTTGIVAAVNRSTMSEYTNYPNMIQTNTAINPGSSGGPLLSASGEMVGLNTTSKTGANDMGYAIPVDRVREALPEILDPERRLGFLLGLRVATEGPATVTDVAKGSPAEAAGVQAGDVVLGVGGKAVVGGIDYLFALMSCRGGEAVTLHLTRAGRTVDVAVTPAAVLPRAPDNPQNLSPGVVREYYEGTWTRLPDFATLTSKAADKTATFDIGPYRGKDYFGLRLTGYIDVPADGVWAFYLKSDDGSRLWIGDRMVVDNDGSHPLAEKRGFIPLKKGKHAIRVEYFERTEAEELMVSWEGPKVKKQAVPAGAIFSSPEK
jgi:S1-C subfamily serine protease